MHTGEILFYELMCEEARVFIFDVEDLDFDLLTDDPLTGSRPRGAPGVDVEVTPLHEAFNDTIQVLGLRRAIHYEIVAMSYGASLRQWMPVMTALEILFEFFEFTSECCLVASVQGRVNGAGAEIVEQSIVLGLSAPPAGRNKFQLTVELSDVDRLTRGFGNFSVS